MVTTVLTMTRGDTKQLSVTIMTGATPQDLTGGKLFFTAKLNVIDADPGVFQLAWQDGGISAGITVISPPSGIANVYIAPAATNTLADYDVELVWDLEFVSPAGDVFTVARGTLLVSPDVTRST